MLWFFSAALLYHLRITIIKANIRRYEVFDTPAGLLHRRLSNCGVVGFGGRKASVMMMIMMMMITALQRETKADLLSSVSQGHGGWAAVDLYDNTRCVFCATIRRTNEPTDRPLLFSSLLFCPLLTLSYDVTACAMPCVNYDYMQLFFFNAKQIILFTEYRYSLFVVPWLKKKQNNSLFF